MVRQRSRPGQGPGKAKRSLCRKDSSGSMSENLIGKDEGLHLNGPNPGSFINVKNTELILKFGYFFLGWAEAQPDTPVDEVPPGPEVPEKIKKRYRKKKTKLEEAFPTYLQVCQP